MDITIILLIVNVFAALIVIGLVLVQQPKGDMGSAFGGGGSQSMFGSRGSANFLTKSTSWMCFIFFATSLMLAYLYAQGNKNEGVVDQSVIQEFSDLPSIGDSAQSTEKTSSSLPELPINDTVDNVTEKANEIKSVISDAIDPANENVIEKQ